MRKRVSRQRGSSDRSVSARVPKQNAGWMMWLRRGAVVVLLALAGCSDAPGKRPPDGTPPNPLIFEIASADGTVEGWMVGTIHALPPGTDWRTPVIERAVSEADLLIVEIADLDNRDKTASTFSSLSTTPALPPLNQRLPKELAVPLADMFVRGGIDPDRFESLETWAAAIILAQVDATGDPANGVDRALIREFDDRPVHELEGAKAQLSIFDRLPEATQRVMLASVVRGSEEDRKDPARLQRAWISGDAQTIERSAREGILADPILREKLLIARNQRWAVALDPVLQEQPRPLIAVGAAHLVGPDGIVSLLEAQGYHIRRLP